MAIFIMYQRHLIHSVLLR
uniref:Uncharacterized protein n=1 Tax=Anguilla anguilla TaxID=7936 RepID=A0A0E9PPS3_ANGAN